MKGNNQEGGCGLALVKFLLAVVFTTPFFLMLFTSGVLTNDRGTEAFYGGALGILGALVIAIALQVKPAAEALFRFFGRADSFFMVLMLFAYFGTLIGGGAAALSALQACSNGFCGSSDDLNNVLIAIISGTTYLVTLFTIAVYDHLVDLKREAGPPEQKATGGDESPM
jgi:hypothetical protein